MYEAASPDDGERILVDRLWPRGLSKEKAAIDIWEKDVAPSAALRKWFGHDPDKFLQAFVGIGLCPDTGGVYMLPRMIGTHRAFDMFVTGRPVDAKEAFQIGLIKEITAKEDLLPKTMAFAKKLTKGPALAYRNMKKLMFESMYKDFETFMAAEEIYLGQCSSSEDFKEGITAFLEKRPADFRGK